MKDTHRPGGAMRRARKLVALLSLSLMATSAVLVGTASTASADPTNCTTVNGGNFAESRCTDGTGEHRVVMRQQHFDPAVGLIVCEGPWVMAGVVSRTPCAYHSVISVTVQTRPTVGPGMSPQPDMPPRPDPSPQPGLDCRMTSNGAQLRAAPSGLRALSFGFTLEYCYNSDRDLVRVTPRVQLPQIQLPQEEAARGLPIGSVGTVRVTSTVPFLGQITQNNPPLRTSQGAVYTGSVTVNLTFDQTGAPRQIYQSTVGVFINSSSATPTPPVLIRSA
nr:hypothetical protein [Kibdelosporangium sp. MJ126-NF4]CEL22415.1 hypothetical protein [Kibdelosporangium sp. MJ126-NF4]CTQ89270.1 hypothetical protein [Kibdelosporangium sp. MJ126-NF4]